MIAVLLLVCSFSVPASADEAYSESATSQTFYSLVAYARMKNGLSPLYVFDQKANNIIDTVGEVKTLAGGIVASKSGNSSIQNWIDSTLAKKPASGSEWYIIALSQNGKYDFNSYKNALIKYLESGMPASPTAQKLALALIAAGKRDGTVQTIADIDISKSPIMAQVFGLHVLNNGIASKTNSVSQVKTTILNMQKSDGGWSVWGNSGDVDVTAMVLQALAPYYSEPSVRSAVDRALSLLSSRQNANGSFSSMGKENCESTAQVITALSNLKIDCLNDSRFQKNGKTPLDALKHFRLSNGGFSHLAPTVNEGGGSPSENSGESGSKADPSTDKSAGEKAGNKTAQDIETQNDSDTGKTENAQEETKNNAIKTTEESKSKSNETGGKITDVVKEFRSGKVSYKTILVIVLFVLAGCAAVVLVLIKKANRKNIALLICIFAALCSFVVLTNFESVSKHNKTVPKDNAIGTVTISIRCDNVIGKSQGKYIPANGCILEPTEIKIEKGDTVYDVLCAAVKQKGLHMEKKGSGGMVYVSGIQYLYEFDFGDMSGWVYHVNGESPFVGCDSFEVKPGDNIEWMYTLDLGVDTGNSFGGTKGEDQ